MFLGLGLHSSTEATVSFPRVEERGWKERCYEREYLLC